ncbi:MAG: (2Fe-2S)-binding protein [Pseudohongiellaceae bacterium]|jgi:aerobic-type carbon monoxide dehydrogenase small subunit (CoxS/CutS family)
MAESTTLRLNGSVVSVTSTPDTPLLYVLTDELQMQGPRFGCGLAQCGACSVLVDGRELRSCVTPLAAIGTGAVTTLEGLPALLAERRQLAQVPEFTPLQLALIAVQALQCGYCSNGMQIKATELLMQNPAPTEADIRRALDGHLCRCGTYPKILEAIQLAAQAPGGAA